MRVNRDSTAREPCGSKTIVLVFVLLAAGCSGNSSDGGNNINPPQNDPPQANDPVILDNNGGAATIGDVLTGDYKYSDAEGDPEGASTYRWLRNGVEIPGATAIDYTLTGADSNQSIAFEVTPVASSGDKTGTAATSYTVCAGDGAPPATTADQYVFAVPKNLPDSMGSTRIFIDVSGQAGTRGTLAVAGGAFNQNFIICSASERLELPATVMLEGNRTIESKGVSVIADNDIAVQVSSYHRYSVDGQVVSADGYAAIPASDVGIAYTVNGISSSAGQSGFAIVNASTATANASVTVTAAAGSLSAGQSDFVTLSPGQAIQYVSATGGDLSGSSITADQPVGVVSFNTFATIPDGVLAGSFVMEQLAADAKLGTDYYLALPSTRSRSTVRIVGLQNNTTVITSPSQTLPILKTGDSAQLVIDTPTTISADHPISVMQFSHGEHDDNVASSAPFMLQVPSTSQLATTYRFVAPDDNIGKVFTTLYLPTADVGKVQLNGVPVDPLSFTDIDTTYSIGTLNIASGYNLLQTTGSGMGAILYGYGDTAADASGNGIPNGVGMMIRK